MTEGSPLAKILEDHHSAGEDVKTAPQEHTARILLGSSITI